VEEGLVVFSDVDIIKYAYRALDTEFKHTLTALGSTGN
jgi:hypothetical protein